MPKLAEKIKKFERHHRVMEALKRARSKPGLEERMRDTQRKAVPRGNSFGKLKAKQGP